MSHASLIAHGDRLPTRVKSRRRRVSPKTTLWILAALLPVAILVCLNLGSTRMSFGETLAALFGFGDPRHCFIVWQMRLPRIVIATLVGAGTATAGAIMQGVSRNDLASGDTLGVNAGAGLGLVFLLVAFPGAAAKTSWLMPAGAIGGAAALSAVVFTLAYKRGTILPARLLLVGVAVSLAAQAAMLALSLRMSFVTYNYVLTWMSGSLSSSDWSNVYMLLPWIAALIPFTLTKARTLDVFSLGDFTASGLGAAVDRERLILLSAAIALNASCAALGGHIGFLGLIAPHLARRTIGQRHGTLLPAAALVGAILLIAADALAKNSFAPTEIPAGVAVGVIGGAYFLYLLAVTKN